MDLETENRIASILLREAAELRRQAEKEGVRAYLEKPNVRHRPNSRFLTATVLGVQQANKAVETNEMWSLRSKEIEFDERLKRKSREESSSCPSEQNNRRDFLKRCTSVDENVTTTSLSPSSSRSRNKRWQSEDDDQGLGDVEVKTFLQSRVKRGRGSVGARMDEPLPCLPVKELSRNSDTGDRKLVLQPDRSPLLRRGTDSSSSDEEVHKCAHRKRKEHKKKLSSKKHKSKEKKRDRKKRKYCRD
ncbi:unnamed protein product [Arabidopsis lyrata]|uniref:AT4g33690/T16L1_180 n=1 Tax=Arabidopsis lyrata subsp. lyrata TaxID=81972 RepID=D7MGG9_ARALL|nr:uncharacterized protein LOC9303235 [Arabidopsis lyrata subsp. lyrata]XP_020872691.1 uncharacterized protein LOC9303235 [Arabidopsis lyrata subsp. lyrata]EFH45458.1 AT4g33690/T16L1_180 [Arabidopsis lyrata subsp. lyrata]CAH8274445.1 unnamed protein product [Arabidopsis lyrata]|eukprot:XP_002869199.1 uncharacterized protein LOC9303235 [Arabidopsis lyrata subsp. lyrata]